MCPAWLIEGIAVILGNGLSDNHVWADVPPLPVLTSSTFLSEQPGCVQSYPVMSTALVTWTVSRADIALMSEFSKPQEKMNHWYDCKFEHRTVVPQIKKRTLLTW